MSKQVITPKRLKVNKESLNKNSMNYTREDYQSRRKV